PSGNSYAQSIWNHGRAPAVVLALTVFITHCRITLPGYTDFIFNDEIFYGDFARVRDDQSGIVLNKVVRHGRRYGFLEVYCNDPLGEKRRMFEVFHTESCPT